jgi:hypothetical protein
VNLHKKNRLLNKVTRIANELGHDVGRLSIEERDAALAHEFSNAVDALRLFQRRLAINILAESLTTGRA